MQRPAAFQGCPPGLEYLSLIDRLQVKQVVSLLEAFTVVQTSIGCGDCLNQIGVWLSRMLSNFTELIIANAEIA